MAHSVMPAENSHLHHQMQAPPLRDLMTGIMPLIQARALISMQLQKSI